MWVKIKTFEFVINNRLGNTLTDPECNNIIGDVQVISPENVDYTINNFCYGKTIRSIDVTTYESKGGLHRLATPGSESIVQGNVIIARYTIVYESRS